MEIRDRDALIEWVNRGNSVKYLFFWGHQKPDQGVDKRCLSQRYESPFSIEGKPFQTAEHYMMYQKAVLFQDPQAAQEILAAKNPGAAKALGRGVHGFDEQTWREHRFGFVVRGNIAKFDQNPELKSFLLGTGDRVLVEASPRDRIWGIGLSESNPAAQNPNAWRGQNLLGFALMEARLILKSQ